jgi:hypothetical protein
VFLFGVHLEVELPTFPSVHKGSNLSTYLSTLVIICPFDYSHPSGYEVDSCGFDLYVFHANDVKHLFMCLLAICICSLEKSL